MPTTEADAALSIGIVFLAVIAITAVGGALGDPSLDPQMVVASIVFAVVAVGGAVYAMIDLVRRPRLIRPVSSKR